MSLESDLDELFADENEVIVRDPLRFKARLGIGDKAYKLLRAREQLRTFSEALGVGGAGAYIAGSTVVAGTFFAKKGMVVSALSAVGLGAAAATPIGWVLAAGVVSGVAYMGVSRFFETSRDEHLVVVPKYINTPMDVIALALIELMLPVSLKIARASGEISDVGRAAILEFYCQEWGYSRAFIARLIEEYEKDLDKVSFARLAQSLSEYCAANDDCERDTIVDDLILHLREVIEAGGVIHEQELRQLEYLSSILVAPGSEAKDSGTLAVAGKTLSTVAGFSLGVLSKGAAHSSRAAVAAKAKAGSLLKRFRSGKHKPPD
jgi:hypothetical protein